MALIPPSSEDTRRDSLFRTCTNRQPCRGSSLRFVQPSIVPFGNGDVEGFLYVRLPHRFKKKAILEHLLNLLEGLQVDLHGDPAIFFIDQVELLDLLHSISSRHLPPLRQPLEFPAA